MSLPTCLKIGTATGFLGGLISSAYFTGAAASANKNDNPATFALAGFSLASIIGGPVTGSGTGLSYYGLNRSIKYLHSAPKSIQITILLTISLGIAAKGASVQFLNLYPWFS